VVEGVTHIAPVIYCWLPIASCLIRQPFAPTSGNTHSTKKNMPKPRKPPAAVAARAASTSVSGDAGSITSREPVKVSNLYDAASLKMTLDESAREVGIIAALSVNVSSCNEILGLEYQP
jgi:hypothetical protein